MLPFVTLLPERLLDQAGQFVRRTIDRLVYRCRVERDGEGLVLSLIHI